MKLLKSLSGEIVHFSNFTPGTPPEGLDLPASPDGDRAAKLGAVGGRPCELCNI